MIFFYGFLLFGSQVHHIWAPGQEKTYNILAFVTLGFCVADMILRILVEPDYFQFHIASFRGHRFGQTNGATDSNQTCSFGSFLFWCDLLSTSMILYDISWINDKHFETKVIELVLDDHGFPVCCSVVLFHPIFCTLFHSHTLTLLGYLVLSCLPHSRLLMLTMACASDQVGWKLRCWLPLLAVQEWVDLLDLARWSTSVIGSIGTGS
jgi:hypothetical protein